MRQPTKLLFALLIAEHEAFIRPSTYSTMCRAGLAGRPRASAAPMAEASGDDTATSPSRNWVVKRDPLRQAPIALGLGYIVAMNWLATAATAPSGGTTTPNFFVQVTQSLPMALMYSLVLVLVTWKLDYVLLASRTTKWPVAPLGGEFDIASHFNTIGPPKPVADGWGYFIRSRYNLFSNFLREQPAMVALSWNYCGIRECEGGIAKVRSGTWLGDVCDALKEVDGSGTPPNKPRGLVQRIMTNVMTMEEPTDGLDSAVTLVDRTQFDQLGFGSMAATCGHGWSSRKWFIDSITGLRYCRRGQSETADQALVSTVDRKVAEEGNGANARPMFWEVLFDRDNYVILEVHVQTVKNMLVRIVQPNTFDFVKEGWLNEKNAMPSPDQLERLQRHVKGLLTTGDVTSPLPDDSWENGDFKLVFVQPSYMLWKHGKLVDEPVQPERNVGVWENRLNTVRRYAGFPRSYTYYDSYADAHTLIQDATLLEQKLTQLRSPINAEFFVAGWTNEQTYKAIAHLAPLHNRIKGRTELRMRNLAGSYVCAVDVVVQPGGPYDAQFDENGVQININQFGLDPNIARILHLLHAKLGVSELSAHYGKYIPSSVAQDTSSTTPPIHVAHGIKWLSDLQFWSKESKLVAVTNEAILRE
mmetsp:Transcript_63164/g.105056  ORF Transcript_63164/g.105056 Transcript_63164/m.105056 type:complete len:643 (-) Transcript_63164:178-2106(-)